MNLKTLAYSLGIGLLLGCAGGFFLARWVTKTPVAQIVTSPVSTGVTQFITDLIKKNKDEIQRVTDSSRAQLGTLKKRYDDSISVLRRREQTALEGMANAHTTADSLAKCTVVALTCRQRADLAEARVVTLSTQLARQTAQQPKRCGADLGPGLGIGIKPLSVGLQPIQLGVHCRIFDLF